MHRDIENRTGRKSLVSLLLSRATLLPAALLLAGATSLSAHAASFECKKSSSYSEKQVCGNAYLSQLDDKLNAAYKRALSVTPDKQQLEDARDHQWKWRQTNCHDEACVTNWYERRIVELNADYKQGVKAQRVAFELDLDHQNLAPGAAQAIRDMKATQGNKAAPSAAPVSEKTAEAPAVVGSK